MSNESPGVWAGAPLAASPAWLITIIIIIIIIISVINMIIINNT